MSAGARPLRVLVLAMVVITVGGCRDAPSAQTLTIGLADGARAADRADAGVFGALVEGLSGQAIDVELHQGPPACGEPIACFQALRTGEIAVAPTAIRDVAHLFPELAVLELPYLFENEAVIERVFDGPFRVRLGGAIAERTGLRLMAFTTGGWRGFATSGRPVRSPEDVAGLTLWVAGSPVETALVERFGASPSAIPRDQLLGALESGQVDGVTMPLPDLVSLGLHEAVRHVTLDRHSPVMTLWLMNEAAYRAFPPHLQQVVRGAFDEMGRRRRGADREGPITVRDQFLDAGGEVHTATRDERLAFLMAAGGVAVSYMEEHGADWLVRLEAAIADAEAAVGSSLGP